MPVTAKLFRKFYDQFGDEIANELVEWFNKVDDTYKAELRELNELNFARFDAKMEQRLTAHAAIVRSEMSELRNDVRDEIAKLGEHISALDVRTAREMVTQTRWMVGLWAAQITLLIGTVLVVLRGP